MILLVGAGPMARDYAKVLTAQERQYVVVGRGECSAQVFEKETGHAVVKGGLADFLATTTSPIEQAIISVGVEVLAKTTHQLIAHGVKQILVEKPAGLDIDEIKAVVADAQQNQASIYVAYNRRFFGSVMMAQKIIKEDGGVDSFNFELTEWGHVIGKLSKAEGVLENWFLANTTHVTDLAFFLGGKPEQLSCFTSGEVDWHKRSSNFSGAGRTSSGALFSYNGNWNAPGRWSVEMLTRKHRLVLRPMEQLQIQKIGSVAMAFVDYDEPLDKSFKPGVYQQVESFITGQAKLLCSIEEQLDMVGHYIKMAGYDKP